MFQCFTKLCCAELEGKMGVWGCTTSTHQWNDEEAMFQTFSDQSPNICYERFLYQWLNSPYQLRRGPIPVTKVLFDFLISVLEGSHFIVCLLGSPSTKGTYFSDWRTLYQLQKARFSVIKSLISVIKAPYLGNQNPLISKSLFTRTILYLTIDILEYVFNWPEYRAQTRTNHKRISCNMDCHEFITNARMKIATCKIGCVNKP